jgi:hypothetical protein
LRLKYANFIYERNTGVAALLSCWFSVGTDGGATLEKVEPFTGRNAQFLTVAVAATAGEADGTRRTGMDKTLE